MTVTCTVKFIKFRKSLFKVFNLDIEITSTRSKRTEMFLDRRYPKILVAEATLEVVAGDIRRLVLLGGGGGGGRLLLGRLGRLVLFVGTGRAWGEKRRR